MGGWGVYGKSPVQISKYVYFWSEGFRFQGGWVGLKKSEHCSDFKNMYVFLDAPLYIKGVV